MAEKMERIKPVAKGRYASVADMARDLAGDAGFSEDVAARIRRRYIIDFFVAQRTVQGLSQKEIAEKMGCTQSRISKLERGGDSDLRVGDIQGYAAALGLEMTTVLTRKGAPLVEQVKQHAFAMRRLLMRLVSLTGHDTAMAGGAQKFLGEVIYNSAKFVMEANEKLQENLEAARENGLLGELPNEPPPLIQIDEDDDGEPASRPIARTRSEKALA